jgi:hypothetical protein
MAIGAGLLKWVRQVHMAIVLVVKKSLSFSAGVKSSA